MSSINIPASEVADLFSETLNQGGSSAESMAAPRQVGEFRIPRPKSFRVLSSGSFAWGGSYFVLAWQDIVDTPDCPVKGYRIYTSNAINDAAEPSQVGGAGRSPGTVTVSAQTSGTVVFWLQPFLIGGQTLPLEACPTCTAIVPEPTYALTITDLLTGEPVEIRIDNDIPSGGGGTASGLGVKGLSNGGHAYLSWNTITVLNANDKLAGAMSLNGSPPAAGAPGIFRIANGTGTGAIAGGTTIQIEGNNGKVRVYNIGTSTEVGYRGEFDAVAPLAATTRYLVLELGGVRYKIQCDSE